MKKGKKLLSILLAVCMIFTAVPMMAGAAEDPVTYAVTATKGITANPEKAEKGESVLLTVDEGYELDTLKAEYKDEEEGVLIIGLAETEDGHFFIMPEADVTVTATFKTQPSSKAAITSFVIDDVTGVIDEAKKTVTLTVRTGTDVTKLVPEIEISDKATIKKDYEPVEEDTEEDIKNAEDAAKATDFTKPVVYIVTAEDGTEVEYTVSMTYKVTPAETGVDELLETEDHTRYLFGFDDGKFMPNNNMTRAEVVAMFYNLLQDKTIGKNDKVTEFSDVPVKAWYEDALDKLSSMGIISGYTDGTFGPGNAITRAEFASIVAKFISNEKISGTVTFPDISADAWYLNALKMTMGADWWTGDTEGKFNPTANITRAQAATVVNKMLDREADKEYIDKNKKDLFQYIDMPNADSHWAYYTIMEASISHKYEKTLGGESWTSVLLA